MQNFVPSLYTHTRTYILGVKQISVLSGYQDNKYYPDIRIISTIRIVI